MHKKFKLGKNNLTLCTGEQLFSYKHSEDFSEVPSS